MGYVNNSPKKNKMEKKICIYCGSSAGNHPVYADKAKELAGIFLEKKIALVYGAGNIGIMGILADTMLSGGGQVIGVIPELLVEKEVVHDNLTELHIVRSMHERKALLSKISDAFMVLPGGFGTMDEMFEALTWNQLGIISKPVGLLNIHHYFDKLVAFLDQATTERFIRSEHRDQLIVEEDGFVLVEKILSHKPVKVHSKWIEELKLKNRY